MNWVTCKVKSIDRSGVIGQPYYVVTCLTCDGIVDYLSWVGCYDFIGEYISFDISNEIPSFGNGGHNNKLKKIKSHRSCNGMDIFKFRRGTEL